MDIITKQKIRVQAAIRDGRISRRGLARVAQIRDTVLIGMLREDWDPRSTTLAALVGALDKVDTGRPTRAGNARAA